MPRYRVKDGALLPHNGETLEGGTEVELPQHVGEDPAIRGLVEAIDAAGHPFADVEDPDAVRFLPHERLGFIKDRMVRTSDLLNRLTEAAQALEDQIGQTAPPIAATDTSGEE